VYQLSIYSNTTKENNPILNYTAVNIDGQIKTNDGIVADRNENLGWFEDIIK
jgi:hypothetical protein